jgi:hypothetical protein
LDRCQKEFTFLISDLLYFFYVTRAKFFPGSVLAGSKGTPELKLIEPCNTSC